MFALVLFLLFDRPEIKSTKTTEARSYLKMALKALLRNEMGCMTQEKQMGEAEGRAQAGTAVLSPSSFQHKITSEITT